MTLAPAAPEATVVENDPAQALLSAQADGLLTYHGFVSGNRYEVEAHGRHWSMPAADALLTVARLRALDELARTGALIELQEIRSDGAYVVRLTRGDLVLAEQEVIHWCAGYLAAQRGNGQPHVGKSQIDAIADLFEQPSLDDQCRMVILGLMYGGVEKIGSEELAEKIGALPEVDDAPVKKTIVGALGFGKYLSSNIREWMIQAFGLRWRVGTAGSSCEPVGKLAERLPEMPGLVRLRALAAASRSGWLRYLGQPEPNKARWLAEYALSVGGGQYVVPGEALLPWLDGVEAFHQTASVPKHR